MMEIINKITKVLYALYLRSTGKAIFINNYKSTKNMGDMIHTEIIRHYAKKICVTPPGVKFWRHYLLVGSILDMSTNKSVIIGAGTNKPNEALNVNISNIRAVRGHLTLNEISKHYDLANCDDILLGDPAVLMPNIYTPAVRKNKCRLGVVFHYVDETHGFATYCKSNDIKIISIRQKPCTFIDELNQCQNIFSSSLHGLILSDAYDIPNQWIQLSDRITGGDFKFEDYYSTTEHPKREKYRIKSSNFEEIIAEILPKCSISKYAGRVEEFETLFREL